MARKRGWNQRPDANTYIPSRRQIAAACRKIQAGWSDDERTRRRIDHHLDNDFGSGKTLAADAACALIPRVADSDLFADVELFEQPMEL